MSDPIVITQSGWKVEAFEGQPATCRHIDGSRISTTELLSELGEAAAQKKRWEEIEGGLKKCLMDYADAFGVTSIDGEKGVTGLWRATIITQNRKTQVLHDIGQRLMNMHYEAKDQLERVETVRLIVDASKGWNTTKFPWMAEEPYSIPQLVRFPRLDRQPRLAPGRAPTPKE